jgi:hypothetical protein
MKKLLLLFNGRFCNGYSALNFKIGVQKHIPVNITASFHSGKVKSVQYYPLTFLELDVIFHLLFISFNGYS